VIQGFGLARPMPLAALIDWLHARAARPGTDAFGTPPQPVALSPPARGHAR
jgi:hypothetical protein